MLDYAGAEAVGADTVVHWVGGAQVRYTASVAGGANVLEDVRRMAGNTMVTQGGSGPGYSLKRQVVLRDRQGSIDQVLGAMTLEPVNASSPSSFDAWGERRDTATWSTPVPWSDSLEQMLKASTTQGWNRACRRPAAQPLRRAASRRSRTSSAMAAVSASGGGSGRWLWSSRRRRCPLAYSAPCSRASLPTIGRGAKV